MKLYSMNWPLEDAMGTENIKYLPDEREQRVKLLETIKAIGKAVFDKHLSAYGKFEDFWSATKQMQVKDSYFADGITFKIQSPFGEEDDCDENSIHSDVSSITENQVGIKFATMEALKTAYEQVSNGAYVYGALFIPEVENMGFVVYYKVGQGKYVGVTTRYTLVMREPCFGMCGNFGNAEEKKTWDYGCNVRVHTNCLEA